MKTIAILLEVLLLVAYYVLARLLITYLEPMTTVEAVVGGMAYGIFMIISLGHIFESLPKSISKYYKNKA